MITSFWKTLSSLKCAHSSVKIKVESWWLKQILVIKKIYYYSGKIRARQLIFIYSSRLPLLPRTRWRVTWIKTDVVGFWRTFSQLYFEKAETCFFFSAQLSLSFSCTAIRGTNDMTYFTPCWEGTKEAVTVLDRVCCWEPFGFFEQL